MRDVFVEKWLTSLEDVGTPLAGVILQLSQPQPVAELQNNCKNTAFCLHECPPVPLSHFPHPSTMLQPLRLWGYLPQV